MGLLLIGCIEVRHSLLYYVLLVILSQLSVDKGLQLGFIAHALGHVCKLVEHFHKSTNAMHALRKKQELLGTPQLFDLI